MRVYVDTNFKNVQPEDLMSVLESVFHQLEDQLNGGPNLISLVNPLDAIPKGALSGDIVFSLAGGEIKLGVYNGRTVSYASFGSFTGALTDIQHGNRGGGSLHPVASQTVSGFMSFADKVKSDNFLGETSTAALATTTEYPASGNWGFHKDTTTVKFYLVRNFAGAIKSVEMT